MFLYHINVTEKQRFKAEREKEKERESEKEGERMSGVREGEREGRERDIFVWHYHSTVIPCAQYIGVYTNTNITYIRSARETKIISPCQAVNMLNTEYFPMNCSLDINQVIFVNIFFFLEEMIFFHELFFISIYYAGHHGIGFCISTLKNL